MKVIAALAVSLAPFSAGLGKGYSSPAIASLQDPAADASGRDFHLSDQQASWLASLSFLVHLDFDGLPVLLHNNSGFMPYYATCPSAPFPYSCETSLRAYLAAFQVFSVVFGECPGFLSISDDWNPKSLCLMLSKSLE
ncbi:hypothetical protein EVAR_86124_1 [Eumeta japonica]|uniref:Uncharacterized protein n=1 Tax=Eumeta variegata TaxID=151549 RepID=A0A4C1V1X8_EUMVA|nr:hypothetical protein EVAR_86124_1 [Eumeta japonica]